MSEYNKFLSHFNKSKKAENDDGLSEREDTIPVKGAVKKTADSEAEPEVQKTEAVTEKASEEIKLPGNDENTENSDEIRLPDKDSTDTVKQGRFIKTKSAQFIAVNASNRQDVPTTATKYTDRLLPKIPERKIADKKENANTYDGMHSPAPDSQLFFPADEAEKTNARKKASEKQTPEKTAQPQTKILPSVIKEEAEGGDTKGVIVEKIPDGQTKDISGKGNLLREIAKTSVQNDTDTDDGQLTIEGFMEENNADSSSADDEAVLEELSRVRENRIKNFRFWTKSAVETGESEDKSFSPQKEELRLPSFLNSIRNKFSHLNTDFVPMGDEEYQDPSRRKEIFASLMGLKKSTLIKALFLSIIGIILLIINIVTAVSAAMNNGFFSVFGGSAVAYNIVNLVILLLCGTVMADDLKKGIFSILKIRPRTDTALLIMYLGALAQNITAFFSDLKPESDYHLLSGAVVLLCVPVLLSKAFYYDSTRHCFKAVGTTSDKCYLRKISDKETISDLLKDNNPTETNVVYTGKTRFISGFLKRSAGAAFSGQASSRVICIAALGALISGIIGLIVSKSPVYALGCFSVTASLSFPVSCLLFTGFMISSENSMLSVKSSFIGSYSDAYSFCCIDDIILDGDEVFSAEIVSSAVASNVSQKQAEFCAAVLTNKADGILRDAFSVFSQGLQDRYPEVDGLVFEDKLGLSAWISDCRVLLGTKQFLVNHNVELPEAHTVPFMLDENTRPLFLAIEGHFAAAFSVKYSCDKNTAKSLCSLAANGANILLSIKDPNITEDFGEELLRLPKNSLRIMSNNHNSKFTAQKNTVTDMEDTGIVFSDSLEAFSRTLASAIKLEKIRKTSKMLCEAASIAGILLGILFCATGALTFINGWPVVILQLCWLLLSFALTPSLSATTLKKKITVPEIPSGNKPLYPDGEDDLPDFEDDSDIFGNKKDKPENGTSGNTAEINEENEFIKEEEIKKNAEKGQSSNRATRIKDSLKTVFTEKADEDVIELSGSEEKGEQLIIEGVPYTRPPEVADPDAIKKLREQEEAAEEKEKAEKEQKEPLITDDILDAFAQADNKKKSSLRKTPKKQGLLQKLGIGSSINDSDDSDEDEAPEEPKKRKSVFSVIDEKIPTPPKYDLNKKDVASEDDDDSDPLNAKFVPPDTSAYQNYYKDDFFSSFDTEEDDKAFADIRRKREERESTADEFDFWIKK